MKKKRSANSGIVTHDFLVLYHLSHHHSPKNKLVIYSARNLGLQPIIVGISGKAIKMKHRSQLIFWCNK